MCDGCDGLFERATGQERIICLIECRGLLRAGCPESSVSLICYNVVTDEILEVALSLIVLTAILWIYEQLYRT
jgi:hypothetical protein